MITFKNIDELSEYLIMNEIEDINKHYLDDNLNTLLHYPQSLDIMKELIKLGGEKELTNVTGVTPIMKQYKLETIRYLYEKGCDINKKDIFQFNIFHWPKEKECLKYLYDKGVILYDYNVMYRPKDYKYTFESNMLLINGGFDPYNESYFSLPGIFLQRDIKTIEQYFILRNHYFSDIRDLWDMCHETFLFKPCITCDIIKIYYKYGDNINHINFFGNNSLFVHHDINIIRTLLECGIDYNHKNNVNLRAIDLHKEKNNKNIYILLLQWEKCIIIQRNYRIWRFRINYIPIKNYKKKNDLIMEILYSPPSKIYIGGDGYHKCLKSFTDSQKEYLQRASPLEQEYPQRVSPLEQEYLQRASPLEQEYPQRVSPLEQEYPQ